MSILTGKPVLAAIALSGAAAVGVGAWFDFGRTPVPEERPVAAVPQQSDKAEQPVAEAPETEEATDTPAAEVEQAAAPDPDPAPEAAPVLRPVAFDEVRREEDGTTIIAGRAHPQAEVLVLMDDQEITRTAADRSGKFAAIAFVAPDGQGHVLSLLQIVDGQQIAGLDQIILAPLAPPVVVADAPVATQPEEQPDVEEPEVTPPAKVTDAPADAPAEPVVVTEQNETPTQVETEQHRAEATAADDPATTETAAVETPSEVSPQVELTEAPAAPQTQPVQAEAAQPAPRTPEAEESQAIVAQKDEEADAPVVESPSPTEAAQQAETPAASSEAKQSVLALAAPAEPATPRQAPTPSVTSTIAALPAAEDTLPVPPTGGVNAQQEGADPGPGAAATPETAPQVAVLKATQDGVELLNVPRPDALENIALDTISYSDSGDVQLAGRAQAQTRAVNIYLNNASVVTLPVDEQGRWRGALPEVDEGIYTLRVDEVAQDGRVTSRVETPFKREDPEVLAQAVAEADGPLKQITVQKGATLWAIARDRYGDGLLYVNVFRANADSIRDPDLIYPGQVFQLPD